VQRRHLGGYLLVLSREEDGRPLGFVALRRRPGSRGSAEGFEISTVVPAEEGLDAAQVLGLAGEVSAAAGAPWGRVFPPGVGLARLSAGAPVAAQAVARRAGVGLVASADAVAAIRQRQQAGALVAFVSDSAQAAPAFADCDLAVGLAPGTTGDFPARADLLAADLGAVAAVLEAGARRDLAVRDAVAFSFGSNVFGALWSLRGRPGVEVASRGVYGSGL